MTKVEINLKTFLTAFVLILLIYLTYQLRSIVLIVFVAFIIFSALKPIVDLLEKKRISRILAVLMVYLGIASVVLIIAFFLINSTVSQIRQIADTLTFNSGGILRFVNANFPFLNEIINVEATLNSIQNTLDTYNLQTLTSTQAITELIQNLSPIANQSLSFVGRFVSGLISIFMVIFLSIYMVIPKRDFYEPAINMLPKRYSDYLNPLIDKVRVKLGAWIVGQIVLMFAIGISTYLIVLIPGIFVSNYSLGEFALILGIVAGFLEALPNIGPLLTLIIAVILAIISGGSFALVLYIIFAFTALQQAESVFLVPVVMKKAIDLNPIVGIVSVLGGFELGGTVGALLAIPIVGVIQVVLVDGLNRLRKFQDHS